MNHDQIAAVAAVLRESPTLTEIEIRGGTVGLRLRRASQRPKAAAKAAGENQSKKRNEGPATAALAKSTTVPLTASVVGVFRVMGGAATIAAGDTVKAGQVIGQIEAIRLLNDCIAPSAGTVVHVAVHDSEPVEYGQLLFEIEPAA